MNRADDAVGSHRLDDILRVGARARIVIDLGPDREAHAAPQAFRNDRRVRDVDAGGFGGSEKVAGLGELERSPHGVDGARIFERQIVDVIGDHQKPRRLAAARVVEPKEEHARRIRDRTLLGVGPVFALRVAVNVGNRRDPRIAQEDVQSPPSLRLASSPGSPPSREGELSSRARRNNRADLPVSRRRDGMEKERERITSHHSTDRARRFWATDLRCYPGVGAHLARRNSRRGAKRGLLERSQIADIDQRIVDGPRVEETVERPNQPSRRLAASRRGGADGARRVRRRPRTSRPCRG